MHPEIEKLIKLAIADGEITEKERGIILRKAEKLGEDKDEVEMIIDGEIALAFKELNKYQLISSSLSTKEGNIKKCPSCGAPVNSFNTKCDNCGHEFRGSEASSLIKRLNNELQNIETEERTKQRTQFVNNGLWKVDVTPLNNIRMDKEIIDRKIALISTFPVPNTKEDILEFLALATANASRKPNFMQKNQPWAQLYHAWVIKCQQMIMKARFSMKDDRKTLDEIEFYAKQLKIK